MSPRKRRREDHGNLAGRELSELAVLGKVVELSHGSANASAFEAAVLELLQREIGFDFAYFTVKGSEAEPRVLGLDRSIVQRIVARSEIYLNELLPVKRAAFAAQGVAVDTEVLGSHRVREMQYFREIVSPSGGQHSLMAYLPWRNGPIAAVMLGRAGGTFSKTDICRIESLLPTLGVARAAFGLPWVSAPLGLPATRPAGPSLLSRLGFARPDRPLASARMSSGTLVVRDRDGFREMVASDGKSALVWTRASLEDPGESGWPYVDLFHIAAGVAKRRRRALFVGCGGGVALRKFASVYPGIVLDVVEHEPAVIDLARSWYALDDIPELTVHLAEGIDFVSRAPSSTWDVAVIDAFDTELLTAFTKRSFFAALKRSLCPGGAMAFNLIGSLDGYGPLPSVVHAARAELRNVRIIPVMGPEETYAPTDVRNIVVVGTRV